MSKDASDIPAMASWTVTTYLIYEGATKCSQAFYITETAKTEYMDFNTHSAVR